MPLLCRAAAQSEGYSEKTSSASSQQVCHAKSSHCLRSRRIDRSTRHNRRSLYKSKLTTCRHLVQVAGTINGVSGNWPTAAEFELTHYRRIEAQRAPWGGQGRAGPREIFHKRRAPAASRARAIHWVQEKGPPKGSDCSW